MTTIATEYEHLRYAIEHGDRETAMRIVNDWRAELERHHADFAQIKQVAMRGFAGDIVDESAALNEISDIVDSRTAGA